MCSRGQGGDPDREPALARLEPQGKLSVEGVEVAADDVHLPGLALEGHGVAFADPVTRDGDPLAVHEDMAVTHQLAGLGAAGPPGGPEGHVVQAQFEQAEEVLAGDPRLAVGLGVDDAKLLLQDAVDAAGLLLLPQLGQVLRTLAHPVTTVLSGRVGPAVAVARSITHGTFGRIATLALQEQLGPLVPAQTGRRARCNAP